MKGLSGGSPYSYNNSNQLTATPNTTFTYGNNGNTLTKTDSNGTTSYTWDYENRLTSVTLAGGGGTVTFKYDPFGRRIQKSGASTTNYVYDGANVVAEYDAGGNLLAHYDQGLGVDEPLAMSRTGAISFFQADGLGSVTSLTDSTGTAVATYTYDALGSLTASSGAVVNPYRYTGREYDSETGLYYYRARYYDPQTGRFIAEDPIQFRGGSNFFSYVRNNPVLLTDPLGLDPQKPSWWQRLKERLRECWKDPFGCGGKPGSFGPGPDAVARNLCDSTKGQKYLFGEASPINPYYGRDVMTGRTDPHTDEMVAVWEKSFRDKCEANPNGVTRCGSSPLGPSGPYKVCACCEECSKGVQK